MQSVRHVLLVLTIVLHVILAICIILLAFLSVHRDTTQSILNVKFVLQI